MQYIRTQVYLDPTQHKQLKQEAARRELSLTQVVREAVGEYLVKGDQNPAFTKDDYMSIVALGASGKPDGSDHHDDIIGDALSEEHE